MPPKSPPKPKPTPKGKDAKTGQFVQGNRFWQVRSTHGRKPIFKTAEQLQDACAQYFIWVEENPLYETKGFAFQGVVTKETFPKMRAMTLAGLCLFIGVTRETWNEWRSSRPDFSDVQREAEEIIYAQKFAGAAADLLNANIIARDLGLSEKQEHTSPDGSMSPKPLDLSNLPTEALEALVKAADAKSDD